MVVALVASLILNLILIVFFFTTVTVYKERVDVWRDRYTEVRRAAMRAIHGILIGNDPSAAEDFVNRFRSTG